VQPWVWVGLALFSRQAKALDLDLAMDLALDLAVDLDLDMDLGRGSSLAHHQD
jgi:hypothetical protein